MVSWGIIQDKIQVQKFVVVCVQELACFALVDTRGRILLGGDYLRGDMGLADWDRLVIPGHLLL
jgi:hypothetical protein